MAQGGLLGNGMKVAYSVTSPISWVNMRQLREVSFPTYEADKVEKTTHSTTNKLKKYMSGLIEVGDPSFVCLQDMDPSTCPEQKALRDANKVGTSYWWRFETPVNVARTSFIGIEFQASVKNVGPDTPIDGVQTVRFTLSFDGEDIYEDAAAGASEIS